MNDLYASQGPTWMMGTDRGGRFLSLCALCAFMLGLAGCKPEPPKAKVDAPFIHCAAFDFRVNGPEEVKAARRLMFDAAMDLDMPFSAAVPFGGFRDVVGQLGYPHRIVLSSEGGPWMDPRWLRVELLAGGPPQRVPWLSEDKQPYVPPSECLERELTRFGKVIELFGGKWSITELDVSKPVPMRFRSDTRSRAAEG